MNVLDRFNGVKEIQLEPQEDERGFFMRVYDDQIFNTFGIHRIWVQENHSLTEKKDTIRGLHFQVPPYQETKLVRVIHGEIYDVFVDLRRDSSTFGQGGALLLSAANKKMVYIPKGFAHGFLTLTKNCEVLYKMDSYYAERHESSIKWDDPDLDIEWPVNDPIVSEKDAKAVSFKEFKEKWWGFRNGT